MKNETIYLEREQRGLSMNFYLVLLHSRMNSFFLFVCMCQPLLLFSPVQYVQYLLYQNILLEERCAQNRKLNVRFVYRLTGGKDKML